LPEFALVAKRQPLELSIPLHFFCSGRVCVAAQFGISVGCAQTTKFSRICPSVGNNTNANVSC
jgi:hypothetical protein